ncbi:unnamed protein product, partial [Pelagomonas calceolata]
VILQRLGAGQRPRDVPTEHLDVVPVELRRLLVQGVVGVRLVEEVDQPVDDGVDVEDRLPVLAQDVEADVALEVDVRVEDLRVAVDLRRLVRVHGRDREGEVVGRALPEARVRRHDDVEFRQVVRVGKLDLRHVTTVQFRDVLLDADLAGRLALLRARRLRDLAAADAEDAHLLLSISFGRVGHLLVFFRGGRGFLLEAYHGCWAVRWVRGVLFKELRGRAVMRARPSLFKLSTGAAGQAVGCARLRPMLPEKLACDV